MAKIDGGFLLIARRMLATDSWVWRLPDSYFKLWIYLIYRARWKSGVEPWWTGRGFVDIARGQLVASERTLADAVGMSRSAVRRALATFTKTGAIEVHRPDHHFVVVTLTNYETYQSIANYSGPITDEETDQPRTNRGPTANTEGKKGKEREAGKGLKHSCPEPAFGDSAQDGEAFPCVGSPIRWTPTPDLISAWSSAYPALDVRGEIARARAWIISNPAKRKTARGMPRFLNSWLERAQNSGRGLPAVNGTPTETDAQRRNREGLAKADAFRAARAAGAVQ